MGTGSTVSLTSARDGDASETTTATELFDGGVDVLLGAGAGNGGTADDTDRVTVPAAGSIVVTDLAFSQAVFARAELPERVAQTSKPTSGGSKSIRSGIRWLDPKSLTNASASAFACELTAR
jgi:hypothetical protein